MAAKFLTDKYVCKICNKELSTLVGLGRHVTATHAGLTTSKEYYDTYSINGIPTCEVCNGPVKYNSFTKGYYNTCGHKCGAILNRRRLAADTEKHNAFKKKVSENQIDIWKSREESGEASTIRTKIRDTTKRNNAKLTPAKRKERFGWLNKLPEDEKQTWINEVLKNTGMYEFWKNASPDARVAASAKRLATLAATGKIIPLDEKEGIEKYYHSVRYLTEKNYKKYKDEINPCNLIRARGNEHYQLDHNVSIAEGFLNSVPPEIISCKYNLQMLQGRVNNSKNADSWMTINELTELYKNG